MLKILENNADFNSTLFSFTKLGANSKGNNFHGLRRIAAKSSDRLYHTSENFPESRYILLWGYLRQFIKLPKFLTDRPRVMLSNTIFDVKCCTTYFLSLGMNVRIFDGFIASIKTYHDPSQPENPVCRHHHH